MHFAFPNECPYPHLVEEAKALTPSHWFDKRVSVEPGQRIHLASTAEEETRETAASSEIAWASQDLCQRRWQNGGFSENEAQNLRLSIWLMINDA